MAALDEDAASAAHCDGKVALVTGAASGIGEACVARFLREGARVVGVDVAEPTRDLDVPDGCRRRVVRVARRARRGRGRRRRRARWSPSYGRLDVVVTAAGVAGGGPAHLVDRAEWQRVLDVNLTGTFLVCKHAIARMLEQEPVDGERGSHRHDRERRRPRRHGGRQLVQRVEGRGRDLHEEPRDRLRRAGHPRQRDLPRVHRDADARRACSACPGWKQVRAEITRRAQAAAARAADGDRGGRRVPRVGPTRRSSPARRSRSTAATPPAATTASPRCSASERCARS